MIGKVSGGASPKGIFEYCYYEKMNMNDEKRAQLTPAAVRGEIKYFQGLVLSQLPDGRYDMKDLAEQFENCADKNPALKKFVWHQSFSFPKGEVPSDEQIEEISKDFSSQFGFDNNQLITFKHTDKQHDHFHIVANRIDYNGTTTAKDSNSFKRIGNFCREMEKKHNLTIVENMFCLQDKKQVEKQYSKSDIAEKLKNSITQNLMNCFSLKELEERLKREKIKMYTARGISFFDQESKAKFKGSEIGRLFSFQNINFRLNENGKMNSMKLNETMIPKNKEISREMVSSKTPKVQMKW